ncbi:MAG: hypothetical protein GY898_29465 [Proteobacteria bacterium]|nr:hypothetical protein [Pseudomonadota bacterium]
MRRSPWFLLVLALGLVSCTLRTGSGNDPEEGTRDGDCADDVDNDGDNFTDCDD